MLLHYPTCTNSIVFRNWNTEYLLPPSDRTGFLKTEPYCNTKFHLLTSACSYYWELKTAVYPSQQKLSLQKTRVDRSAKKMKLSNENYWTDTTHRQTDWTEELMQQRDHNQTEFKKIRKKRTEVMLKFWTILQLMSHYVLWKTQLHSIWTANGAAHTITMYDLDQYQLN
jgi:hypothetical protein